MVKLKIKILNCSVCNERREIPRLLWRDRLPGHLKTMFCPKCKKKTLFIEEKKQISRRGKGALAEDLAEWLRNMPADKNKHAKILAIKIWKNLHNYNLRIEKEVTL